MIRTSTIFIVIAVMALLAACKEKKASLSGDEPVEVSDFIDFFPEKKLPYLVSDTVMTKKDNDSLLISYKIFTQFVPDSILTSAMGKVKPKIYPMARITNTDIYLFAKAVAGNKRVSFLLAFDKKNNFLAGMPLLSLDQSNSTQQTASLDTRYSINKTVTRRNADGSTSDGKDVYVLNSDAKKFSLIMTDALDERPSEIINPIDTLARKQKFTADYGSGTVNLFSFRDGRRADRISFFIHFERNNGECTGELKGEAMMKSATRAEYREPGEPCALEFNFTANAVTVKEIEGCGSRRGLRCSFNGTYARKKEAALKATKPKRSTQK